MKKIILSVFMSVCFVISAWAELKIEDSFLIGTNPLNGEYTAGVTVAGQNPSTLGANGAWVATSSIYHPNTQTLVYEDSLGHMLSVAGGSIQIDIPGKYTRTASHPLNASGANVIYISSIMYLGVDNFTSSKRHAFLRLTTAGGNTLTWGIHTGIFRVGLNSAYAPIGDGSHVDGKTYFIVMKVELDADGTKERVTLYVDPADITNENSNTPTETIVDDLLASAADAWVNLNIYTGSDYASGTLKYDELRMGTTWSDVVPYVRSGTVISIN